MRLIEVDASKPAPEAIEEAAIHIEQGGIVAIPTDTVYGLVCDYRSREAVERLFELKGRESSKPLALLVGNMRIIGRLGRVGESVKLFMEGLWPGGVTFVLPKRSSVPGWVSAGLKSVGLRMPDQAVALALLERCGGALASSSANLSGGEPARSGVQVAAALGAEVELVLEAGEVGGGEPSTVVDFCGQEPRILRAGAGVERVRCLLDSVARW